MKNIKNVKKGRRGLAWVAIGLLGLVAIGLWSPVLTSGWNFWQFSNEFKPAAVTPLAQTQPTPGVTPTPNDAGLGLDFTRLGNFGLATGLFSFRLDRYANPDDAQKRANFDLRLPQYAPADFRRADVNLLKRAGFKFTLDLGKARPYLKEMGIEVALPDDLNGKTIIVTVGDILFTVYQRPNGSSESAQNRYLFASGGAADLQLPNGINLEEFREGAARVPVNRLPPVLYSQWGIIDPQHRLPVPPGMSVRPVSVDGVSGRIYRTTPMADSTLAWQKDGIFYFLNGGLSDEELVKIANSLANTR
jgi:hypothetical protein